MKSIFKFVKNVFSFMKLCLRY